MNLRQNPKPSVDIVEEDGATVLVLMARNTLVTTLVTLVAGLVALAALMLAVAGLATGAYGTAFVFLLSAAGVAGLGWWLGWQPKPHRLVFRPSGLEAGPHHFDYSDDPVFGIGHGGGGAFDPASMPVSRNTVAGPHLYIEAEGQRIPLTVTLGDDQARLALEAFGRLYDRYRAAGTPEGPDGAPGPAVT